MAWKQHADENAKCGDDGRWRQRGQWKTGEPNYSNGWGETGWWKQNHQQSDWKTIRTSWVAAGLGKSWSECRHVTAGKPPDSDTVAEKLVAAEKERKMMAEKEATALVEKKMLAEKRVAEQMIAAMTKNESQRRATLSKETARKVSQFSGMEFYN